MPRRKERLGDEPRPAARVEDARSGWKLRELDQPRERNGIALQRRALETGRLLIERLRQLAIVRLHRHLCAEGVLKSQKNSILPGAPATTRCASVGVNCMPG